MAQKKPFLQVVGVLCCCEAGAVRCDDIRPVSAFRFLLKTNDGTFVDVGVIEV